MEDVFTAETLFDFDYLEYNDNDSNNMEHRKIVVERDKCKDENKTIAECTELTDEVFTPPTDNIAPKDDNNRPVSNNNSNGNYTCPGTSIPNEGGVSVPTNNSLPNNLACTPCSTVGTPSSVASSVPSSVPITELDEETKTKIMEQVEFYFSDANVTKDKELAKQIRRNEMGYVSIKWITSFRKIQALTQDWKAVSRVLAQSAQLKVSTDKKMVRRKHPIPKKSDQFADRTVMASNLPLTERSVDSVKDYFNGFGKVTLVRFLMAGKPYPDDIANLHLSSWRGSPSSDMVAVEFDTVEAAELAVLKLSDSNNWRSSSQVQLLRSRQQKAAGEKHGPKVRKASEHCSSSSSMSYNHSSTASRECNGYGIARSLPKQMFGMSISGTSPGTSPHGGISGPARRQSHNKSPHNNATRADRSSISRSTTAGSVNDSFSCSPSANSYLGQRMAMEKSNSPVSVSMVLVREPKGPDGSKGFGHRSNVQPQ